MCVVNFVNTVGKVKEEHRNKNATHSVKPLWCVDVIGLARGS